MGGSLLAQEGVVPSLLSLLCSHCLVHSVALLPGTLTQLCLVPRAQGSPSPAWLPAHHRSSFPSGLPAASLSQFPCAPCPSPVCPFSVPSSLGSSGWSAAGTLPVFQASWSALLLPLSQFHSSFNHFWGGFDPCRAGTLEQSTGMSQITARELPQHQQWEW